MTEMFISLQAGPMNILYVHYQNERRIAHNQAHADIFKNKLLFSANQL